MITKNLIKKIVGYGIISVIATSFDIAILYSFTEFLEIHYLISATIGYITGMIISYTLNKKYNFKDFDKKVIKQFLKFGFIATSSLLLGLGLIYLLVEYLSLHYMIAKLITLVFTFIYNFLGHNLFSFTKQKGF